MPHPAASNDGVTKSQVRECMERPQSKARQVTSAQISNYFIFGLREWLSRLRAGVCSGPGSISPAHLFSPAAPVRAAQKAAEHTGLLSLVTCP